MPAGSGTPLPPAPELPPVPPLPLAPPVPPAPPVPAAPPAPVVLPVPAAPPADVVALDPLALDPVDIDAVVRFVAGDWSAAQRTTKMREPAATNGMARRWTD